MFLGVVAFTRTFYHLKKLLWIPPYINNFTLYNIVRTCVIYLQVKGGDLTYEIIINSLYIYISRVIKHNML